MPARWCSPPARTCRRRCSCRSGWPAPAPTCSTNTPSSPSTDAAWAARARSTASSSSTARRSTTRRSSKPGNDPVANLADIVHNATTSCTDTIAPGDSAYDNTHAATDIERLRSIWDVPAMALIGIGNGAQVALSYASAHPDKVARLVLDSPLALGVGAEAAAEQRVKGQQAALDAFAAQCAAVNCPLGPDPKGAVSALLADARTGHGPAGASVAAIVSAISTALGYPTGDRVGTTNELATALAAARAGDANQLANLINRAQSTGGTDGQFVNSCSDAVNRPTPDRVRELVVAWAKLYPQFGTVGALNLVKCARWPSTTPPQPPKNLKINVLLLGVQNDPIVGIEGVAATRRHHHQRHRRQQAGDVAGHRPRRQHLLAVRGAAAGRLPRQRQVAGHRHVLSRLILRARIGCARDGSRIPTWRSAR